LRWHNGNSGSWPDLAGLRGECEALQQRAAAAASEFAEATLRPLAYWIAKEVLEAAKSRAAEGASEFHDLLVLARDLLRSNADVRATLQRRFPGCCSTSSKDTDPIRSSSPYRHRGRT
jgi:superfamily I DNA/RNA helicase